MPPSGPSTPTGPSSSTSTPLKKVPPTGPKAQGQSFAGLPTGPRAQPVAIPFGGGKGRKTFGQGQSQSSSGTNLNTNSNYNRSPYPQSTYQYGSGYDQSSSPHHGTSYGNGGYDYSGPSSHAESSRQALAKSIPTGPSGPRDKKQKAAVTSTREVGIPSVPGSGLGSGSQSKDSNGEGAYGSTLLHTEQSRTPIKIAFPTFQTTTSSKSAPKAKTKSTPHPPPPPDDRPPTPPLGDGPPPPPPPDEGPPPPPDMAPPPSPSPSPKKKSLPLPRRSSPIRLPAPSAPSGPVIRSQTPPTPPPRRSSPIRLPAPPGAVYPTNTSTSRNQRSPTPPPRRSSPIRLPPPPTASLSDATASHSKLPPTPPPQPQPVKFSIPTQTQKSALAKDAPPSFHFRNIPVRRSPSPTKSSAGSLAREPTPPPREATPRAPTPPPYIPEPYIAPASVVQRAGLGNFRITHDPALEGKKDKGKEVKRRFDGEGLDKVEDPRLALPVEMQKRGRGTAKQRTEFHEIEYSWDNNSVGRKPLPLPCAVLLTGLNPLTTTDQISQYLRPHGRIREMDSRMDTKSGMQLGICWVKFDTPSSASGKSAHEIANTVVKVCNGQRIRMQGDEKIKVVLDGRGLRAQKAVKEEMERRYKPKPKPVPKAVPKAAPPPPPMPTPAPTAPTPASTHEAGTPKSDPHTNSNGSLAKPKPSHALHALPSRPIPHAVPLYANNTNRNYASLGRSQPVRPPMPNFPPSRPTTMPTQAANPIFFKKQYTRGDRDIDLRDNFSPRRERSRSRSRDRDRDRSRDRGRGRDTYIAKSPSRSRRRSYSRDSTHSTDCPTCPSNYSSDSGDERHYRPTYRRRSPGPRRIVGRAPVGPSKEDEAAMEKVKIALAQNGRSHIYIDETSLSTRDTSMSEYLRDHFRAFHPKQILSSPKGWYILFDKEGVAQNAAVLKGTAFRGNPLNFVTEVPAAASTAAIETNDSAAGTGGQKAWRYLTITKKNRPQPKPVAKKVERKRAPSFSSSSSDSGLSDTEPIKPTVARKSSPVLGKEDVVEPTKDVVDEIVVAGKKRPAKPKALTKNKKAKLEPAPLVEIPAPDELPVAEIKIEPTVVKPKPKKAAASPIDKLIETGVIADDEDAYWLGQALAEIEPIDEAEADEQEIVPEDHPLYHQSGSWRAEGFKSIPKTRKSEYLPQQNKAAVAQQDAAALTSGRTARVTGRRLAHDIETTRRSTTTQTSETDTFAFNQLRTRKKQLKFSRSPIEGYGLYAMETIAPGEMVCEYVGEIVRSAVAEVREQRYLKQGIGSSYLFRIDAEVVCDATFRGSVSRLINHSCDPSASAKIITINGHSKIVIYARTMLHPGQEILYDYKFPLEEDPALRVACLCGAATCRGWLN